MSYRDKPEDIDTYVLHGKYLSSTLEVNILSEEQLQYIQKYNKTLRQLISEQKELCKVKNRLKELYSDEGSTTKPEIASLEESAQDITTLIWSYRNSLDKLEMTPFISDVIERETVKSYCNHQEKEIEEIFNLYEKQRLEALKRLNEREAKQKNEKQIVIQHQEQKQKSAIETVKSIIPSILFSILGVLGFYLVYGLIFFLIALVLLGMSYVPVLNLINKLMFIISDNTPDIFAMMLAVSFAYLCTMGIAERIIKKEKTLNFTLILMGIYLVVLNVIFLMANLIYHEAILVNIVLAIAGMAIFYKGKKEVQ